MVVRRHHTFFWIVTPSECQPMWCYQGWCFLVWIHLRMFSGISSLLQHARAFRRVRNDAIVKMFATWFVQPSCSQPFRLTVTVSSIRGYINIMMASDPTHPARTAQMVVRSNRPLLDLLDSLELGILTRELRLSNYVWLVFWIIDPGVVSFRMFWPCFGMTWELLNDSGLDFMSQFLYFYIFIHIYIYS